MWPNGEDSDKAEAEEELKMEIPPQFTEEFMRGLEYVANTYDYTTRSVRQLEDGYTEIVFEEDNVEEKNTIEIDVRMCKEEFQGRKMLELRIFPVVPPGSPPNPQTFFMSPIPYVLWGAIYCQI